MKRRTSPEDQQRSLPARAGSVLLWYVLPGLAIGLVVAYIGAAVVWHANPPVVPVNGVSMKPTFEPGDLVFVKGVDPQQLHKGEIVAFHVPTLSQQKYGLPGRLVHRIIKIQHTAGGLLIQTKGDNNPGPDAFQIRPGDIVGRVVARAPGLGYPLLFFRSRQGEIFLGAAALVALVYFLIGLFEDRRAYVEGTAYGLQAVLAETEQLRRLIDRAGTGAGVGVVRQRDENTELLRQLLLAVGEYGVHLRSHTAVMQGLAATTNSLEQAASRLSATVSERAVVPPVVEHAPRSSRRPLTMAIDPNELREPPLERSFRGYTPEPVNRLLTQAAVALEQLVDEREQLHEQLETAEQQLAEQRNVESNVSQALVQALAERDRLFADACSARVLLDAALRSLANVRPENS